MLIENEFVVPAPIERAWDYLLDVEKVAPCAPGGELTGVVDDRTWKGRINMKLGPIALSFAGTVTMAERDDANHRVVLRAQGQETKGKGAASATVTSWLEPGDGVTTVKMEADITLTGTVAQLSRGLLPEVSARLTNQFAECLRSSIGQPPEAAEAPTTAAPPPARPKAIAGVRLGFFAFFAWVRRSFRRLYGRRPS